MEYKTKSWRQSMRVRVNYEYMTEQALGERGISCDEINQAAEKASQAFLTVKNSRGKDELFMGWTELPYNQGEIVKDIISTAKAVRKKFKYFVVLGIGGSALGPAMAFNALKHLHYNELSPKIRRGPKFYVEDNVDPVRMAALLDVIEPGKTCFNVISKSGATSETMAQFLIVADILEKRGVDITQNMVFTTDAARGNLVKIDKKYGGKIKKFVLPDGVGGRFSELSPVGLFPAAVLGININAMLAGAAYMDKVCSKPSINKNPALMCAMLQYISMQSGKNVNVIMPYSDRLKLVADWYCQLWAESVGKAVDNNGETVNTGSTPVKSLGVTDQHSQVQLYTEGPYDKVVTFISVDDYNEQMPIPEGFKDIPDVSFLGGHTMSELIKAENKATAYALKNAGRQNYSIILPEINAFTMGELIFLFELQTAYAGAMLNVNAFNQPGVENGKKATFALLGKNGYEKLAEEIGAENGGDNYTV